MTIGVEMKVAQLSVELGEIAQVGVIVWEAEPESHRDGEEARGSNPRKRRMISSPSSSYLDPPMP